LEDKNSPPDPAHAAAPATPVESHGSVEWPPRVEPATPIEWPIQANNPVTEDPPRQTPQTQDIFAALAAPPVPDDLNVPWGWLDILLLVAIAVLGSVAVGLVLVMGARALGINLAQLRTSNRAQSLFLIINQVVISFVLLAYLAAQMRLRFEARFWRTIGWKRLETGDAPRLLAYLSFVAGGFLFAIIVQLASAVFGTKAKLPIEVFFQDRRSALLLMLMGVLVAPVVEETIFRGYLYPVIARTFGVATGVVSTGIFFGLLHAPQLKGGWAQIVLLMVVGIVFTYARATQKTVVASYLLHVSYNSCLFFEFMIASQGFRHLPGQ